MKSISFHRLTQIQFRYTICTINTKQLEFYGNDERNDELYDSHASDDTSESDFDFNYDELVDNFDEFELSEEDIEVYVEELNPMNESYVTDGDFTPISLKEPEPASVLRTFFTEEILNLITDQTNIYGKGKKQSTCQRKTSKWKDVSKKEIESFLGLVLLMSINDSPNITLYWSNYIVFHKFDHVVRPFFEIFYNLHLDNNSLKPKRKSKD